MRDFRFPFLDEQLYQRRPWKKRHLMFVWKIFRERSWRLIAQSAQWNVFEALITQLWRQKPNYVDVIKRCSLGTWPAAVLGSDSSFSIKCSIVVSFAGKKRLSMQQQLIVLYCCFHGPHCTDRPLQSVMHPRPKAAHWVRKKEFPVIIVWALI